MEEWNLYVLRYAYSGNYYVGTSPDLGKRMLVHWRRTSTKNNLPIWSAKNKSTEGFTYYWFHINCSGVSQAEAEHCETALAKLIIDKIKTISEKELVRETQVGYSKCPNEEEKLNVIKNKLEYPTFDLIDAEIKNMFDKPIPLELETKDQIICVKIGNEYENSYKD